MTTAFLDRDGTINVKAPEGDYVTSWAEFRFLPGAVDAVRALAEEGLKIVIVSNQRGIARGLMSEADLEDIHSRMLGALGPGVVDAIYHCPHEEGACDCRKPRTGMFSRAQADLARVDFGQSVVIGDSPSDMQAGRALGSRLVMIGADSRGEPVDHLAPSLSAAADWLLQSRRAAG